MTQINKENEMESADAKKENCRKRQNNSKIVEGSG